MMHPRILQGTSLAAALAACFPACALGLGRSAVTLEPVVVTAAPAGTPLTVVANPKQPRQPLPASDAADYLKSIPGFSLIRNGGVNGDPVLRGMFGSRLNMLMDGIGVLGACPSRMDAPSSYIAPENYDLLTVVKGPQTVLWGPGASAGTIRFERRRPAFGEGGIHFDGSAVLGAGGRNDQNADLAVGNGVFHGRVTANHTEAQDYRDGDGHRVPSRWDKWNADVALGLTPNADTLFELGAGTGDGFARYGGRGMDGAHFKRDTLQARFEKKNLGPMWRKVEAQLYWNSADHVMDNITLRRPDKHGPMPMAMAHEVDRTQWGGRVAATLALADSVDLDGGFDFQHSAHRGRMGGGQASYRDHDWIKDASLANAGIFSELTWRASRASRVMSGARLDRAEARDFRATQGMMHSANPSAGQRRSDILPSGFMRYEYDLAAMPATLYAGLGHTERFPDYWELFSPKIGPAGSANAFSGIKPERTTQLDLGAIYRTEELEAWVSAYAGYVDDFILFRYRPGKMGMRSQASNVDARIYGGELGAAAKLGAGWKAGASLAAAGGAQRADGSALPQMPPLETRLNLSYETGPWSAGALWRLVRAQKHYARNQGNVTGRDFGPSAGFGVVSLNAGYAANKQLRFTLGLDNLFNKTYAEHLNLAGNATFGYPANTKLNETGRTLWARVSASF
jgi:iron complex outermembrane receptor protein